MVSSPDSGTDFTRGLIGAVTLKFRQRVRSPRKARLCLSALRLGRSDPPYKRLEGDCENSRSAIDDFGHPQRSSYHRCQDLCVEV
jgi:hypothetical protein